MNPIILTAIGVGGSTLLGSLIGFFIKNVSHKVNDSIIGLCAGVMLSAAILGLMKPAFEQVSIGMIWLPILGVFAGALLLNLLDTLTPHLHNITGLDREEHLHNKHLNRVLLFVLAIALHKFPEGMAAGVGFSGAGSSIDGSALSVAIAVSLQNIPEGMVIIS
ncbi:MAG: ZIP family metal transporter, partial [Bacteroidales bacterium]|nr:ZIP family metal transporter [Bacteroidales bacterium]